jgi:alcohol dehydrogenase class IV
MTFEFATATSIRFGAGVSRQLGALIAGLGRRALIVTGNAERAAPLCDQVRGQGIELTVWTLAWVGAAPSMPARRLRRF